MNDLISIMALPALWSGGDPSQIARTVIDALQHMFRLELAYIQLKDPLGRTIIEFARTAQSSGAVAEPGKVGAMLNRLLGDDPEKWLPRAQGRFEGTDLSIMPLRLGLHGEVGILVLGAGRSDFPQQTEELLLRVAANQTVIALHEGRLLDEQRRLADELDQRVAQRTRDLAAANRELQLQVGLLQLIPVAAWTIRPDGKPDFVNQKWTEYTGQSFDYVLSEPEAWMTAVHPDDREVVSRVFWEAIRSGQDFSMETRFRRTRDGTYRWHLNRGVALRDPDGTVVKFVGTSTDIEDLKRSQQELRQMTETIPEMLWSATPDGLIDYCNTRLLDYTGFTFQEIKSDGWVKLIHPDDLGQAVRAWMSCVSSGAPYRVEVRMVHARNRTYRWCVTNALPLLDKDNRILKWHGTVVDMHDWRQAQETLRNTQAEMANMARVLTMSQLTASIAHEVNQPLSGIITNAGACMRMLNADPPNVDGARETARRTIRDGNRASDVITRLRALFSKREDVREPIDLNNASREVIALLSNKLQKHCVVLQLSLADDLPLVRGDRVQLQQVIMNLLQNASDAMSDVHDRSRQLLVETQRDGADHVRLTVQDTGVGLDPKNVGRLFDAFYTTKEGGMGIGLSVSRSIVESHGGRIWASLNDGPGATFSFSVPRSPGCAIDERLLNSAQEQATLRGRS